MLADAPYTLAYLRQFANWEQGTASSGETYTLDRMRRFLAELEHPDRAFPIIHVVGTKGKGSTSAIASSILASAGHTVGLFTSPHLLSPRERIRINGQLINHQDLKHVIDTEIDPAIRRLTTSGLATPTYFEVLLACALVHFRSVGVAVAILEAGLGGRLDATNAVTNTEVTVISTIGYDHMDILGDTLEKIATDKTAVIRQHGMVVSAAQQPGVASIVEHVCLQRQANFVVVGRKWTSLSVRVDGYSTHFDLAGPAIDLHDLSVPLPGVHQAANAVLAVAAVTSWRPIPDTAIRAGLLAVEWLGRIQIVEKEPLLILDGAHNKESAEVLCESVRIMHPAAKCTIVLTVFKDKDLSAILVALKPMCGLLIAASAHHPRALDTPAIVQAAVAQHIETETAPSLVYALARAREVTAKDGCIVVTGSFRAVTEALECLGRGVVEE